MATPAVANLVMLSKTGVRRVSERPVIIDARLVSYRTGGIARYARELARWLPTVAPELMIRAAHSRASSEPEEISGFRVFTPPHHRFERWLLGLELLARRPSLIHSPDFVPPLVPGAKKVATVHDLAFLRFPELVTGGSLRYYRQVLGTLPRVDRVIAVSQRTASDIAELTRVDPLRIRVVHNGVDHDVFDTVIERDGRAVGMQPEIETLRRSDRPVVLMVGTVEPRKRIDLALAAVQLLVRSGRRPGSPPALVVVGREGWKAGDVVRDLHRMSTCGTGAWLQNVRDHELPGIYRLADLLLLPSIDEGFGLAGLEAMACGLPVLASDVPALREILGDAAFFESSSDPDVWAARIDSLISDHAGRVECARRGVERARAFSWRRTAEETANVYREVLSE
jgi:glycosyltransferase involved in cell wall biosynthesis